LLLLLRRCTQQLPPEITTSRKRAGGGRRGATKKQSTPPFIFSSVCPCPLALKYLNAAFAFSKNSRPRPVHRIRRPPHVTPARLLKRARSGLQSPSIPFHPTRCFAPDGERACLVASRSTQFPTARHAGEQVRRRGEGEAGGQPRV
jgi:hypothetical protein